VASISADDYQQMLALARRHSRVASEAEDLLQEAMLVATEQGRLDLLGADRPWLVGVLANLARHIARSAVRRKRREEQPRPGATEPQPVPDAAFLRTLPHSARTLAVLAINGMTPDEIRHVLQLSEVAYRQRLSVVRRAWRASRPAPASPAQALAEPDLDFGVIRQALLDPVRRKGTLGTHDPDGNLFLLEKIPSKLSSQTTSPRQPMGEAGT
jgi:RNA polymerase sigma-70 factor (ECF subfamily)